MKALFELTMLDSLLWPGQVQTFKYERLPKALKLSMHEMLLTQLFLFAHTNVQYVYAGICTSTLYAQAYVACDVTCSTKV